MNLHLLEWEFTARKRRRDYTQSAHPTGVNSDLAGGEPLASAKILSQDAALNRKADQGFRKPDDIGAHLEDKGEVFSCWTR